jgi:hypothetical protein
MTPGAVRVSVIVVCVAGIAGMIAGSVASNNAVALTFGLITAAAVLCLIVATAVTNPSVTNPTAVSTEARAERVEAMVGELVAAGADEAAVRALVREVVHLDEARLGVRLPGRGARRTHP